MLTLDGTLTCSTCGISEPCKVVVNLDETKLPKFEIQDHKDWCLNAEDYFGSLIHHCPKCKKW